MIVQVMRSMKNHPNEIFVFPNMIWHIWLDDEDFVFFHFVHVFGFWLHDEQLKVLITIKQLIFLGTNPKRVTCTS
jgi:hypothetical protein